MCRFILTYSIKGAIYKLQSCRPYRVCGRDPRRGEPLRQGHQVIRLSRIGLSAISRSLSPLFLPTYVCTYPTWLFHSHLKPTFLTGYKITGVQFFHHHYFHFLTSEVRPYLKLLATGYLLKRHKISV